MGVSRVTIDQQLRQAQKLEAIGRLAGGIAHDFNNLLTAITGYTELLIANFAPGDPRVQDAYEVRRAALSASRLTRQLLSFSRNQVTRAEVLDVNAVVAHTAGLLKRTLGEDIRLTLDLQCGLRSIKVDPAHLEQIVLNLALNARDAMPEGGELLVRTSQQGDSVRLTCTDTGCGIPEEIQGKVFEPFFTTKGADGTGLGLATVHDIVKQNDGQIYMESVERVGTTFTIDLPVSKEQALPALAVTDTPRFVEGYATILLVEDDARVRQLAEIVLRRVGHDVITAGGSSEALVALTSHPDINLVITDVVMPEMSGYDLAVELRRIMPDLRVVFMSGFGGDHGQRGGSDPFLPKPFTVESLTNIVRQTLDRAAA